MSQFAVIIPAAGNSSRFSKNKRKKPFVDLKGRAVWLRSVEHFVNREDVGQILVVIAPEDEEFFKTKFQANLAFLDLEIVGGGKERADSVQNALARVKGDCSFVAVHDAARPLLVKKWVDQVFAEAEKAEAAILATPLTSTLKRGHGRQVAETVPRQDLWLAQTPQVFSTQLLRDAYAQRGDFQPTDEAQLIERLGKPVSLVECSPMNIKITTEDDFRMAQVLLDALPKEDLKAFLHPFADEDPKLRF